MKEAENDIDKEREALENEVRLMTKFMLYDLGLSPDLMMDGRLQLLYKKNTFFFDFDKRFIRICHPYWLRLKEGDPKIDTMKKMSNMVNFEFGPTVVITDPDPKGYVYLISVYDYPFMPYNKDYTDVYPETLKHILDSFLSVQAKLLVLADKYEKEQESQKAARRVGFAPSDDDQ